MNLRSLALRVVTYAAFIYVDVAFGLEVGVESCKAAGLLWDFSFWLDPVYVFIQKVKKAIGSCWRLRDRSLAVVYVTGLLEEFMIIRYDRRDSSL